MFRFVSRPQVPKLLATAIRTKYSEKLVEHYENPRTKKDFSSFSPKNITPSYQQHRHEQDSASQARHSRRIRGW